MEATDSLPSATADNSLFATVITSLNFGPPCQTREYDAAWVKTALPAVGFTSPLDGSPSPRDTQFRIPALPVK